jgi:hypothetical protein
MTRITTAAPTVRDAGTRKRSTEAMSVPAIGDRIEAHQVRRRALRLFRGLDFPTCAARTP